MQQNLRPFDRIIRLFLGAFLIFAAIVFFRNAIAQFISAILGAFALGEGLFAKCPLMATLGMKTKSDSLKTETAYLIGLLGIQFIIAYEWWSAGLEKVSGGEFVNGLAKTLGFFASKNPFQWYKDFLLDFTTQNATALAYLIEWSQIIIAITLVAVTWIRLYAKNERTKRMCALAAVISLIVGALMNANFYLAAGWTSPSAHGVNLIMFWAQILLAYTWITELKRE